MKLPFLKQTKWPRIGKPVGETRYNFSEEDTLMEDATKELMHGIATKDIGMIMSAIEALVEVIKSKHSGDHDADALKNP